MNEEIESTDCDVLIIGASMAGACLARQLKIKHPGFRIVVLDRKTEFDHWVGESTLESFWDYAVKYLDLGYYLDTNHFYKHGLRFFYDSEEKDLPLDQMSEVGRSWYHGTPAHQIDRKRFDEDLCKMNLEAGIDVRLGVKVGDIEIDADRGHKVRTSDGQFRCRWLVDSAGFGSPLAKKFDLHESNNDTHNLQCYWGRFKNIENLDLMGDREWRARVHNTTRTLATTHFMYGGYWIWLIPVDREVFSIGVVIRKDLADFKIKDQGEFVPFLRSHRCLDQLLGDRCELLDFKGLAGFSRQAKYSFSTDRWFLTGISAAMIDPLLSPGSSLLADSNRMIGDLIESDLAGDDRAFKNKVTAYNVYLKVWITNFFLHVRGLYHDCYDVQRAYFETLVMQWFGVILPHSMSERWGYDPAMTDEEFDMLEQKRMKEIEGSCLDKVDRIAEQLHEYLKDKGKVYEANRGRFYDLELDPKYSSFTKMEGANLSESSINGVESDLVMVAAWRSLIRIAEIEQFDLADGEVEPVARQVASASLNLDEGLALLRQLVEGKQSAALAS